MEVNFGKITQENIFKKSAAEKSDSNFFVAMENSSLSSNRQPSNNSGTGRLNDYDSTILENNAYQEIADEMFKLEHKIGLLESSISKILSEIDGLEGLGETQQIQQLLERKKVIEAQLIELSKKYSELGLSAKISGQIASAMKFGSSKKPNTIEKARHFLSKKVLSKMSKKFNCSQNMKEALEKLSNINSNVDELITMQTPYGEKVNRYEKLTAYLNKANIIHSQISQNLKDINEYKGETTLKSKTI